MRIYQLVTRKTHQQPTCNPTIQKDRHWISYVCFRHGWFAHLISAESTCGCQHLRLSVNFAAPRMTRYTISRPSALTARAVENAPNLYGRINPFVAHWNRLAACVVRLNNNIHITIMILMLKRAFMVWFLTSKIAVSAATISVFQGRQTFATSPQLDFGVLN